MSNEGRDELPDNTKEIQTDNQKDRDGHMAGWVGPTQMTMGTTTMMERMIATTMNSDSESDVERNRDGGLPKNDRQTTTTKHRSNNSQTAAKSTAKMHSGQRSRSQRNSGPDSGGQRSRNRSRRTAPDRADRETPTKMMLEMARQLLKSAWTGRRNRTIGRNGPKDDGR